MVPLPTFPLPLPANGPPDGYDGGEREMSTVSSKAAFKAGVYQRDIFLGVRRCVICGQADPAFLQCCHIINKLECDTWSGLKDRRWIPTRAKNTPEHEPRNGLVLCDKHRITFNAHVFFIRFFPNIRKFVFVNHSNRSSFQKFHGKAIALDADDYYAPFHALFIIHELRVRGHQLFRHMSPDMPHDSDISWQAWILSDGVFDEASGSFIHHRPPCNTKGNDNHDDVASHSFPPQPQLSAGGASSGEPASALNEGIVEGSSSP